MASNVRILLYEDLRPAKGVKYSRQWIGELERAGRWPQRVALGGGTGGHQVGWFEHEIDEFLLSLPRGSSKGRPPWLEPQAAPPTPEPPPRCAFPGCENETAERAGPRGPQPKYCERHGRRRASQK